MMFRRLCEVLEDRLEVLDRRWVGRARVRKAPHPAPTTAHEVKILLTLAATLVLKELVLWAYARVMLEGWPVDHAEVCFCQLHCIALNMYSGRLGSRWFSGSHPWRPSSILSFGYSRNW